VSLFLVRECGAGSAPCTPIFIAAAAAGAGAGGSLWATDLGINNSGDEALTTKFQMLPRGADNTDVPFSDEFIIEPNTNANFIDVWKHFTGGDGAGAINVCVSDPAAAGVITRTYNTSDAGTFGQTIVGMRGAAPAKIGAGEKARLGYLFENDTYRTNIGFMNAGATEITIMAEFFDMEGNSLGTKRTTLAPYSNTQWNRAFTRTPINADDITAGFVDVWTNTVDGAFLTYASIVDNGTGDPTTIWPF